VLEALLNDFPEIPRQAINCSLYINGSFIVRCSEARWRSLLVDRAVILDNGTPLQIRPWSRLFMTEQVTPRYRVRVFIEGLPPQSFTVATLRKVLPSCLFHTVAVSSTDKTDLSYFVVYAWVHDPDTIHKVIAIDLPVIRNSGPLDGLVLPPGFDDIIDDDPTADTLFIPPPMTRFYATVHLDSLVHVPSPSGGGDGGDGHPPARTYDWGGRRVDGMIAGPRPAFPLGGGRNSVFCRLGGGRARHP
jgi:hypothetical protein